MGRPSSWLAVGLAFVGLPWLALAAWQHSEPASGSGLLGRECAGALMLLLGAAARGPRASQPCDAARSLGGDMTDGTHAAQSSAVAALACCVAAWLLLELAFYAAWFRPRYAAWNLRRPELERPPGLRPADSAALFARFMRVCREQPCDLDFLESYLSIWFRGARMADIARGNMEQLFAYGFYYSSLEQMAAAGLGHVPGQMADEFAGVFGLTLAPGCNPRVQFMSHLWDDLHVHWRPLAFYAATEALSLLARGAMALLGFQRRSLGSLEYYTRRVAAPGCSSSSGSCGSSGSGGSSSPPPVVFIHGVTGLLLYLPMLARLARLGAPMLVADVRHVSLRLSSRIPGVDELAAGISAALAAHGLGPALVIGHSYGTLVASRLLRSNRPAVSRVVFVDPVCIGMYMPRLLHSFVYGRPSLQLSKPLESLQQLLLWLVSRDIHMAATFARQFYWSSLNLWPEELPASSCVILGGRDALLHAADVSRLLQTEGNGIKVVYKPHLIHGGFLLDASITSIVAAEARLLAASSDAGAAAGPPAAAEAAAAAAAEAAVAAQDAGALRSCGAAVRDTARAAMSRSSSLCSSGQLGASRAPSCSSTEASDSQASDCSACDSDQDTGEPRAAARAVKQPGSCRWLACQRAGEDAAWFAAPPPSAVAATAQA